MTYWNDARCYGFRWTACVRRRVGGELRDVDLVLDTKAGLALSNVLAPYPRDDEGAAPVEAAPEAASVEAPPKEPEAAPVEAPEASAAEAAVIVNSDSQRNYK